ncbi:hypothetical protein [Vibrio sp. SCSIO 43137]|uniref:hypothetical protein n=1 Tax=Vibrio sp. SCSIO 43137 TaxID=3021011 RepID=UPI002307F05D|nr:hypothetical protein [Vibrio sp. SCSIO 43137]WCE28547.1 hypothetical protein PK654_09205 [Vibrio sp. SCSIO 43137]
MMDIIEPCEYQDSAPFQLALTEDERNWFKEQPLQADELDIEESTCIFTQILLCHSEHTHSDQYLA